MSFTRLMDRMDAMDRRNANCAAARRHIALQTERIPEHIRVIDAMTPRQRAAAQARLDSLHARFVLGGEPATPEELLEALNGRGRDLLERQRLMFHVANQPAPDRGKDGAVHDSEARGVRQTPLTTRRTSAVPPSESGQPARPQVCWVG